MTAIARSTRTMLRDGAELIPDLSYHRGLGARAVAEGDAVPNGGAPIRISVGGLGVILDGLDASRRPLLIHRYGAFCKPDLGEPRQDAKSEGPGADVGMRIRVSRAPRAGFLRVSDPGREIYRIVISREETATLCASYEWAGWFDASRGQGGLALGGVTEHDPRAFDMSVENFLRVVYAHLFPRRGGFLLHAAGLVRDGKAYLFFGPSGSGKTTVTSLTPEATILSDDLTLVVRTAPGQFGACSVPFRGRYAPHAESIDVYPLAGLFRLVQAGEDKLVPVEGARAAGDVMASLPFVTEQLETVTAAMDIVGEAVKAVPVNRLMFRKGPAFWSKIAEAGLWMEGRR